MKILKNIKFNIVYSNENPHFQIKYEIDENEILNLSLTKEYYNFLLSLPKEFCIFILTNFIKNNFNKIEEDFLNENNLDSFLCKNLENLFLDQYISENTKENFKNYIFNIFEFKFKFLVENKNFFKLNIPIDRNKQEQFYRNIYLIYKNYIANDDYYFLLKNFFKFIDKTGILINEYSVIQDQYKNNQNKFLEKLDIDCIQNLCEDSNAFIETDSKIIDIDGEINLKEIEKKLEEIIENKQQENKKLLNIDDVLGKLYFIKSSKKESESFGISKKFLETLQKKYCHLMSYIVLLNYVIYKLNFGQKAFLKLMTICPEKILNIILDSF